MKQFAAAILFSVAVLPSLSQAMTKVETTGAKSDAAKVTAPANQSGKVEAIFAGAGKMVIGGVTYAYNPLSTAVTVNGKRATISDVRVGDTVQFQAAAPGANKAALLTKLSVEKP